MRGPTPNGTMVARILLLTIFSCVLTVRQSLAIQQYGKQKVTIVANEISLESIFRLIEKQTGMRFMYASGNIDIKEKVKASFQQVALDDVLGNLLGTRGFIWQYRDGTILLKQQNIGKGRVDSGLGNTDGHDKVNDIVTGRIADISDIPIPGATVLVKGTKKGTKTKPDGTFSLDNVTPGEILVITSIGFETREVIVKEGQPVLIKMKTAIGALDEAIVIAYGKASNRVLTGNVSTISAEEIERNPVTNPLLALSGRVPGLAITQSNGFSNSAVGVLVQGRNSILKGNSPFYVVDGVPYPADALSIAGDILGAAGYNSIAKGNTLSFLNPADIESITVLKDADATAIYGSRAANGAILITTKKGKAGKSKVNLDYSQGFGKITREFDMMNTQQYLTMRREAIRNDGGTVGAFDFDVNGFWDTTRNTNWQKFLIGNTANYTNINGSVSGGTNAVQYLVGATFHRETTVLPGNFSDQRGAVHFSVNSNSENNKFQVQFSGSYMIDNNKLPRNDLTMKAVTLPPNAPALYNDDGTLNWKQNSYGTVTFNNPIGELKKNFNTTTRNLVSNLVLNYSILPGLNLKSSFGYNEMRSDELITLPLSAYRPDFLQFMTRNGFYGNYTNSSWIVEPQIAYNHAFGSGKLDVLVGGSVQRNNARGNEIWGSGYNTDEAIRDINSAAKLQSNSIVESVYKYAGLFGRINYIHNEKYILNLSARRDGSSRFGPANRFHIFGAVGAAWIFSQEDFIKDNFSFLSFGKLRFSYGTTGNDQIGDFQFLNLYNPVIVGVPYRNLTGLSSTGIYNPNLQWELTKKTNFGLDLGVMKDRILLNANYYVNRSSNQLMFYALPSITGVSSIVRNYPATVQNSGLELTLNTNILHQNKLSWSVNVNLTVPRNKLIRFENLASSSYSDVLVVGESINLAKVFTYAGVNPETGVYQFKDRKGSITSTPDFATDRNKIINTAPKWYAGFSSALTYQGVTLDVLFQYVKKTGLNYYNGNYFPGISYTNQPTYILDRWQKTGDVAAHQRYNTDYTYEQQWGFVGASDVAYSNSSYCRLKNLALSWQLPQEWLKPLKISNAKIYAQGQNLLTFTNYKGLDPETESSTTLPPLKVFVFGLQLGF